MAGLGEANIVTAQSAITDLVPPASRNRYFGYIYLSVSLAYIIGPLVGRARSHNRPDVSLMAAAASGLTRLGRGFC